MNRLPFGSFHAIHFNPQQVQQWRSYIQQMQPSPDYQHYYQEETQQYDEEYNEEEAGPMDQSGDVDLPLSKEAIAIFEFSEAYSAQRKQDIITEDNEDEKSRQETNSILNVSATLHHDGIEAPATSLVLLSSSPTLSAIQPSSVLSPHQNSESTCIFTKQHLLNSSYLESCNQSQNEELSPLVMWPVLPFRL